MAISIASVKMVNALFATKHSMTQAWTSTGKRLAVTRLMVEDNRVLRQLSAADEQSQARIELAYGKKKLKNMAKPLRTQLERGGFDSGATRIAGVTVTQAEATPEVGQTLKVQDLLEVGDVVQVQGVSKGRGFAGGMKRHGFHGGPKTHGQSDRARAVGSIGSGTTPGKVWKGKRMPGHYGDETKTVTGLTVVHLDPEQQMLWLSGPIPGSMRSIVKISRTGKKRQIELDQAASGIAPTAVADNGSQTAVEPQAAEDHRPAEAQAKDAK